MRPGANGTVVPHRPPDYYSSGPLPMCGSRPAGESVIPVPHRWQPALDGLGRRRLATGILLPGTDRYLGDARHSDAVAGGLGQIAASDLDDGCTTRPQV